MISGDDNRELECDESGSDENGLYLAGPVELDDDPWTWRNKIEGYCSGITSYYDIEQIVNPSNFEFEDDEELVELCRLACENNDLLVNKVGNFGPPTVGTHYEISWALESGNDVAVVGMRAEMPRFIKGLDVKVCRRYIDAIEYLYD